MSTWAIYAFFLAWGSFLNSFAYRLLYPHTFWKHRSFCPHCTATIAWYDNIPLLSWILLHGQCRTCKKSISLLYPFIELISFITFILLWQQKLPLGHCISHFIFMSALIISIRTDLQAMLLSRLVTLYAIPFGMIASWYGYSMISVQESILAATMGYLSLWSIKHSFKLLTKKDGLGQGDLELLAFIGSYTGLIGIWVTTMLGSLLGICGALVYSLWYRKTIQIIPFAPGLCFAAIIYLLYHDTILLWLITL